MYALFLPFINFTTNERCWHPWFIEDAFAARIIRLDHFHHLILCAIFHDYVDLNSALQITATGTSTPANVESIFDALSWSTIISGDPPVECLRHDASLQLRQQHEQQQSNTRGAVSGDGEPLKPRLPTPTEPSTTPEAGHTLESPKTESPSISSPKTPYYTSSQSRKSPKSILKSTRSSSKERKVSNPDADIHCGSSQNNQVREGNGKEGTKEEANTASKTKLNSSKNPYNWLRESLYRVKQTANTHLSSIATTFIDAFSLILWILDFTRHNIGLFVPVSSSTPASSFSLLSPSSWPSSLSW
ncbi:hypothetical protein FZEAL_7173 [Fusarium zealandicum]|uniref:Uncharacterized protein n=1 Tax=Fusarium zealandicum TaxID=1053134 RepID=A0A8H4XI43_9HYPO|nr:hypothetical protein FZEAL_7173 [Fusarium zealandicum]